MTEDHPMRYLTKFEVAQALGCHIRTVDRMIARGEVETLKLTATPQGKIRIPRDAFERWLAERTQVRREPRRESDGGRG